MMAVKVVIAPLSTTTITANDLIKLKLNLLHRLIFEGILFGLSFLLNLCLFVNLEEGIRSENTISVAMAAEVFALIPLVLELFHIIFHRAHRTFLAPPTQRSLTSPPSSEISLSPAETLCPNPIEGGVTDSFV